MSSFGEESIAGRVGDFGTPADLELGSDTTTKTMREPIAHGAGVSVHFDDNDGDGRNRIYRAFVEMWRDQNREAGEIVDIPYTPRFLSGDNYVLRWFSSGYKGGMDKGSGWKQWYKHHLMLRRVERDPLTGEKEYHKPATSLNVIIEPQVDGMTYEDGNDVRLPYGEGTRFNVQTTYCERGTDVVNRALRAVKAAFDGDDEGVVQAGDINRDGVRIWKLEAHIRFHIDRKYAAVQAIDKTEKLVDVGGGSKSELGRKRQREGYLEAFVESDRFDHLGFDETDYEEGLKVYQTNDWHERPESDPFHHPKMEAYVSSTNGNAPHISEWDEVLDQLRAIVGAHAEWAGIRDDDLVQDGYFDPEIQQDYSWEHPEGRREAIASWFNRFETVIYGEALKQQTDAAYDILSVITENYGATYDQLEAQTGFSRSNLHYHVSRLVEVGLLETVGNPAIVCYSAQYLYEMAEETLDNIAATHFDEETLSARRLGRDERADERREKRESSDNPDADSGESEPSEPSPENRGGDSGGRGEFVYLEEWYGTPQMMYQQVVDGDLSERDVRVRQLDDDDGGS